MNFVAELRSNSRLRIGLALIVGIVCLSLLIDLRDRNNAMLDQYKQTALQLARLNAQQKQTQWLSRAQDVNAVLEKSESQLWQEQTLGLMQAEMRDWLLHQLLQAKAVRYEVKVSESGDKDANKNGKSGDSSDGLIRVRATIDFNTDPVALHNFLSELADSEHRIAVESLSVKSPQTELTVASWYKLQPAVRASSTLSAAATQ